MIIISSPSIDDRRAQPPDAVIASGPLHCQSAALFRLALHSPSHHHADAQTSARTMAAYIARPATAGRTPPYCRFFFPPPFASIAAIMRHAAAGVHHFQCVGPPEGYQSLSADHRHRLNGGNKSDHFHPSCLSAFQQRRMVGTGPLAVIDRSATNGQSTC